MAQVVARFDLASLGLSSGEGRRLAVDVPLGELMLADQAYVAVPDPVGAILDISRLTGHGYALRLRFEARLTGPCMRCLKPAASPIAIDAREVDQPDLGEELDSPYVNAEALDLGAWAHDVLALGAPASVVCRSDCRGLCPVCAVDLNAAGPEHHHQSQPDPRWAALDALRFD